MRRRKKQFIPFVFQEEKRKEEINKLPQDSAAQDSCPELNDSMGKWAWEKNILFLVRFLRQKVLSNKSLEFRVNWTFALWKRSDQNSNQAQAFFKNPVPFPLSFSSSNGRYVQAIVCWTGWGRSGSCSWTRRETTISVSFALKTCGRCAWGSIGGWWKGGVARW